MTTKPFRIALASLALLTVPAFAGDDTGDSDRAELIIDAGRLTVMMDESGDILTKIGPGSALHPDTPQGSRAYIYETLVASVLAYNVLSNEACRTHIVTGEPCTGLYLPSWLGRPRDYSEVELHAMAREAGDRLQPFWSAVCAKAPKPAGDGDVCPME